MARWQFPDASAEVERLRVELEQLKAWKSFWSGEIEVILADRADVEARADRLEAECEKLRAEIEQARAAKKFWQGYAERREAERDDLAARLQSIQQSERKYTAAKLTEAAKMRKGQAL